MTKLLLKAGAHLEAPMDSGDTPLHLAAEYGNSKSMAVLIEAGANVNSRLAGGSTPLHNASVAGTGRITTNSASLTWMQPMLRRRARRPNILLAALFRWCSWLVWLTSWRSWRSS